MIEGGGYMDCNEFGMLIRESRLKKSMTQKDLAKIVNVSDKAVSKWERGECFPDINLFESLSEALDVSIDKLMLQPDEQKKSKNSVKRVVAVVLWIILGIALCIVYLMLPVGVYVKRISVFVVVCIYLMVLLFLVLGGKNEKNR